MLIERLDWDSQFLGMEVGCTCQNQLLNIPNQADNYDLLYLFENKEINTTSSFFSNRYSFLADCKLIYSKRIAKEKYSTDFDIKEYKDSPIDIEQLYKLAYLSGKYSRYKLDKFFPSNKFEEMYRLWVDNTISGEIADYLFYIETEGVVAAFATLKITSQKGVIGLIATSEEKQAKGMGKALVAKCEETLRVRKIEQLDVATQKNNKVACLFYEKCEMNIVNTIYIYHSWKQITE